jgi:phosphoglycerate dehydrogenase-like enzyme
MPSLLQTAQPVATAPKVLVFALAPPIKHYFFKSFDPGLFSAASCQWLDVSGLDPRQWKDALTELRPTVLVTGWGTPTLPDDYVDSEDISLRYLCHLAGGVKSLVPRRLIERGLLVSNWGESISFTIAEHAILLVLGLLRNLPEWGRYIDHWQSRGEEYPLLNLSTRSLRGKRVGLHGFGAIAREITRMLRPFRVEMAAYSQGVPKSLFEECHVKPASSLEELFATSDVLIECEALTEQTRGTVTERILRLLPDRAIFVNVGRAALVDEAA